jgi:DNA damage-binding protein 1
MLERLHAESSPTDHLFVGTDRQQYFTCSWDAATKQIKTEQSYFDQADKVLRDNSHDRVHIDPTRQYLTLELYNGVVTVVPLRTPSGKRKKSDPTPSDEHLGEPVQVRIEELETRSSAFVQTHPEDTSNPRLAILWEDNQEIPQLKIRELKYQGGDNPSADFVTVAELREQLDEGVSHLIPISATFGGGFLLLGERSISYTDNTLKRFISYPLGADARLWACWTRVDDRRFLLGDDYGDLFFLMIETTADRVSNWRLDPVGKASRASCLVYLDEGRVYIGSHSGDSQVVQIREGGVDVLQTFSNIAPIVDFSIMDLGRGNEGGPVSDFSSGQARIVTASGAWVDGTIRSVRSGVGMEDLGTIAPFKHITDMWALNTKGREDEQDTLIISFIDETKVLQFGDDDTIEELDQFSQFELTQPTLFARNLPDRRVVQVFEAGVRITDLESDMLLLDWKPSDAVAKLTAATANAVHLLVVEGGNTLHVFHTANNSKPTLSKTFPSASQISSVTVPDSQSNVCIVSFWQTATVAILDLHSLEPLHSQTLGIPGTAIPRSVLVANVLPDSPPTLFIAMADGSIVTYSFDTSRNVLSGMTRILLGSEPAFFKVLPRDSEPGLSNVFASCEQPSLIYSSEGRIVYSAVSSDKASRVCHFSPPAYPGAVAIASPSELKLAFLGRERATQLQTLPIGETVRCLAYEPKAHIFGMGCIRRIVESGVEALLSSFKVADEIGFKELDSFELDDQELVECVIATGPIDIEGDEYDEMFIVGTSVSSDDMTGEARDRGRMLVYEVSKEKKIRLVTEIGLKGACRSLAMCDGKIVAGLVKSVCLMLILLTALTSAGCSLWPPPICYGHAHA